ncbi:putative transcriptional regulator, TetR family protein [Actinorhabdospora filicis]|uniref:Transcriptional regulator, TetR family protein n=1 Tax=Actinorhabdospora filicis TaxID=1785913 RepID=A0A9W6SML8_9ACTN|nr:TetR/AcrR family transcriptional regulator [Actinorhabdospora filicis]GLZ79709.1 putative transcriptional regulator, TetR family protein [Actinorhabdospora filicis]
MPQVRGARLEAAVLSATLAELADTGYAAFTMEGAARRAGVHKTTVYRRWADRETLISAALVANVAVSVPTPDTGSFEGDLRALASDLVAWLTSPVGGAVVRVMLTEAGRLPGVAAVKHALYEDRFARAGVVVGRAVERGEVGSSVSAPAVLRALVAPFYLRMLVTGEPLDEGVVEAAVAVVVCAVRAGVL